MEYKVINHTTPENLKDDIEKHLLEGWELAGGVTMATFPLPGDPIPPGHRVYHTHFFYAQAMTRREQRKERRINIGGPISYFMPPLKDNSDD